MWDTKMLFKSNKCDGKFDLFPLTCRYEQHDTNQIDKLVHWPNK